MGLSNNQNECYHLLNAIANKPLDEQARLLWEARQNMVRPSVVWKYLNVLDTGKVVCTFERSDGPTQTLLCWLINEFFPKDIWNRRLQWYEDLHQVSVDTSLFVCDIDVEGHTKSWRWQRLGHCFFYRINRTRGNHVWSCCRHCINGSFTWLSKHEFRNQCSKHICYRCTMSRDHVLPFYCWDNYLFTWQ